MANIITDYLTRAVAKSAEFKNLFNKAFYQFLGNAATNYDPDSKTYIEKGYNLNPDVYACINKASIKTVSVPYEVKKIKNKKAYSKYKQFQTATKGEVTPIQYIKALKLKDEAYEEKEIPFPLEQPNPNQTWSDIFYLYKTYIKTTGNFYLYKMSPVDGMNKGVPVQVYALPAHLMKIVLKKNASMLSVESPIDHYMLIEGNQYVKFPDKDIIHVKYANPNFDMQGEHLYGLSPLRAALRNINSQNSAIDNNIKTLQNAGAFGFIHAKGSVLTSDQADSLKERMIEMDANPGRLSKIAGSSAELGFTRIALTTDELKPFDYLGWDRKTICNVLNFPDELLNNDGKTTLGNTDTKEARKQWITDDIKPDLCLLEDSLNKEFIKLFKGYEDAEIEWDITELPEMQSDMKMLAEALNLLPITPNEFRAAFKYESSTDDGADTIWLNSGKKRIDDVSDGMFDQANQV